MDNKVVIVLSREPTQILNHFFDVEFYFSDPSHEETLLEFLKTDKVINPYLTLRDFLREQRLKEPERISFIEFIREDNKENPQVSIFLKTL